MGEILFSSLDALWLVDLIIYDHGLTKWKGLVDLSGHTPMWIDRWFCECLNHHVYLPCLLHKITHLLLFDKVHGMSCDS